MTARMLVALVGALLFCAAPAAAETKTFDGSTDTSWAVADNWTPEGVPGPADDVTVALPAVIPAGTDTAVRSLNLSGGSLTLNDSTLTLGSGSSVWSAGSLGLSPGSRLNVNGPLSITADTATVTEAAGPPDANPTVAISETGQLTRPSGASLTFQTVFLASGGKITLASGTTSVTNGLYTLGSSFEVGAAAALDAGAPLSLDAGSLSGSGRIARGLVHSAGMLSPDGQLVIDGNYTQSTGNAMVGVGIAGTVPPEGHDQLRVNGAATLKGQLMINTAAGFQPSVGSYFDVISADSVQGTLAALGGNRIGTRASYKANYQPDRVRLVVVGPTASSPPSIPTAGSIGKEVACTPGTYQQAVSYRFQWTREPGPTSSGGPVVGTLQSYTPTAADAGQYLACRVTATNNEGSDVATAFGLKVAAPVSSVVPPALKPADVFKLPSARRCVSRRKLTIRVKQPKGTRLLRVTVYVNKKKVKTNRGARVTATVNLKGLPRGTYKVRIVATTADGRTLTDTRKYKTCTKRRRR